MINKRDALLKELRNLQNKSDELEKTILNLKKYSALIINYVNEIENDLAGIDTAISLMECEIECMEFEDGI